VSSESPPILRPVKTVRVLLVTVSVTVCALLLLGAKGAPSWARPIPPEKTCGWKEDRIGSNPVKTGYRLRVRRVGCRHAHGLVYSFFQSHELPAGWHARYVRFSQELYICRARTLYGCTHGRHLHVLFPDAQ
jgi:hypothetical protein